MPPLSCRFLCRCDGIGHIVDLFKGFAHDMDVINVAKIDLTVGVGSVWPAVLISSTLEFIGSCIEQWACIKDFDVTRFVVLSVIAYADGLHKILITAVPRTKKEGAWLATTPDGGSRDLIIPSEGGQAIGRSEFCAFLDRTSIDLRGEDQSSWVCRAQVILLVVVDLEHGFTMSRQSIRSTLKSEELAPLPLEFLQRLRVEAPTLVVLLQELDCARQCALLEDIFL